MPDPPESFWSVNPGSDLAVKRGCKCAVMDNCHGKFAPFPPDGWYITVGCPVHDPMEKGPA